MTTLHLAPVVQGPQLERQAGVVAALEDVLAKAKEGAFEGGTLVLQLAGADGVRLVHLGTPDLVRTLGLIEVVKHDLLANHDNPEG